MRRPTLPNMCRQALLLLAGVTVGSITIACSPAGDQAAAAPEPVEVGAPSLPATPASVTLEARASETARIQTAPAERRTLARTLEASGSIVLDENRTARVGAFGEGVIVKWLAAVGDAVTEDQVLAWMHSHEVHEAEAEYHQALSGLGQREAELAFAKQNHQRATRLLELKAGSEQAALEAQARVRSAEAALEQANTMVDKTQSHLRYLGLPVEGHGSHDESEHEGQLAIRSPIAGVVVERLVSQGTVVGAGTPAYVISDLHRLWGVAEVPEESIAQLRVGAAVEMVTRAYPDRPFPGRVSYISHALDPVTRTATVRCELPNRGGVLKSEMYATFRFSLPEGREALLIPGAAVQQIDGEDMVFVAKGENSFEARRVAVSAPAAGGVLEVLNGLQAGENVVINGAFQLKSELLKSRYTEE